MEQLREALHRNLAPRRHTALLVAIVTLFMVRPSIGDNAVASAAFSSILLLLLVFALYAIQVDELVGERETLLAQRRRRSMIGWALAVPAIVGRLGLIFVPSPALYLAATTLWLLLFAFITWHLLRGVLRQKEITSETISMSISVYLLLGFTWGLFYIVLHHVQPLALSFGSAPTPTSNEQQAFPILIYFSLTTLSTIGFGDITPVIPLPHSSALLFECLLEVDTASSCNALCGSDHFMDDGPDYCMFRPGPNIRPGRRRKTDQGLH